MEKVSISKISNKTLTNMLNNSIELLVEDFIKIVLSDFSSAKR